MKVHCHEQSAPSASTVAACCYQTFQDKMCVWDIVIHRSCFHVYRTKESKYPPCSQCNEYVFHLLLIAFTQK